MIRQIPVLISMLILIMMKDNEVLSVPLAKPTVKTSTTPTPHQQLSADKNFQPPSPFSPPPPSPKQQTPVVYGNKVDLNPASSSHLNPASSHLNPASSHSSVVYNSDGQYDNFMPSFTSSSQQQQQSDNNNQETIQQNGQCQNGETDSSDQSGCNSGSAGSNNARDVKYNFIRLEDIQFENSEQQNNINAVNSPNSVYFNNDQQQQQQQTQQTQQTQQKTEDETERVRENRVREPLSQNRLQKVNVRQHTVVIPVFSSTLVTPDGSQVFVTDGAILRAAVTQQTPSFSLSPNSAVQTVVVNDLLIETKQFTFVSDPTHMPVIAIYGGCPQMIDIVGGQNEGEVVPFVPSRQLIELATAIREQCATEVQAAPPSSQDLHLSSLALDSGDSQQTVNFATSPGFQQHVAGPHPQFGGHPEQFGFDNDEDSPFSFSEGAPVRPPRDQAEFHESQPNINYIPPNEAGHFEPPNELNQVLPTNEINNGFHQVAVDESILDSFQPPQPQFAPAEQFPVQNQQDRPEFRPESVGPIYQTTGSSQQQVNQHTFSAHIPQQPLHSAGNVQQNHFIDQASSISDDDERPFRQTSNIVQDSQFQPNYEQPQSTFSASFHQQSRPGFPQHQLNSGNVQFGSFQRPSGFINSFNQHGQFPAAFPPGIAPPNPLQPSSIPSAVDQNNRITNEDDQPQNDQANDDDDDDDRLFIDAPTTPQHGPAEFPPHNNHHHVPHLHLPPPGLHHRPGPVYNSGPHHIPHPVLHRETWEMMQRTCGLKNNRISQLYSGLFGDYDEGRISSGFTDTSTMTRYGNLPWQAAILRRDHTLRPETVKLSGYRYICAGSLISPNIVVTAAHCVVGVTSVELLIKLGDHDLLSKYDELYPAFTSPAVRTYIHPDYKSAMFRSDLALLQLKAPAPLFHAPHIGVVCLPPPETSRDDLTSCHVGGWGHDAHRSEKEGHRRLKQITVNILDNDSCVSRLRTTVLGQQFQLQHNTSFCAETSLGQDTCLGDGGAGVVCARADVNNKRYMLIGITSWGVDCDGQSPGIYTDVVRHIDWIYDILGVSPSLYQHHEYNTPGRVF